MRIKLEKNNSVCDMGIDDLIVEFFFCDWYYRK